MATHVTRWQCDHCGYLLKTEKGMLRHEARCFHNPDLKACATCHYYQGNWNDNKWPPCGIKTRLLNALQIEELETFRATSRCPGWAKRYTICPGCDHWKDFHGCTIGMPEPGEGCPAYVVHLRDLDVWDATGTEDS